MAVHTCLCCLAVAVLSGCFDKITTPDCTPVSVTQASVSGDTITTTTGLRYIEGSAGSGGIVGSCRAVAIHYDAFLLDDTKFDSSRDGAPLVFVPGFGDLIDGVEQGVIGMRAAGTRRLIVAPALGFGSEPRRDANGQVVVPGNSTLIFDIEVVEVAQ
jgi:FKBP-type peptidyl-prolyl cis-trans isomerase